MKYKIKETPYGDYELFVSVPLPLYLAWLDPFYTKWSRLGVNVSKTDAIVRAESHAKDVAEMERTREEWEGYIANDGRWRYRR